MENLSIFVTLIQNIKFYNVISVHSHRIVKSIQFKCQFQLTVHAKKIDFKFNVNDFYMFRRTQMKYCMHRS